AILLFCIVGSFSMNNSMFGVVVMLVMGVVAYALEARRFAVAPIILGIVLGPLVEQNFTTSMMIADGNSFGFFERPVAAMRGIATWGIWSVVSAASIFRNGARRNGAACAPTEAAE